MTQIEVPMDSVDSIAQGIIDKMPELDVRLNDSVLTGVIEQHQQCYEQAYHKFEEYRATVDTHLEEMNKLAEIAREAPYLTSPQILPVTVQNHTSLIIDGTPMTPHLLMSLYSQREDTHDRLYRDFAKSRDHINDLMYQSCRDALNTPEERGFILNADKSKIQTLSRLQADLADIYAHATVASGRAYEVSCNIAHQLDQSVHSRNIQQHL